MNGVAQTTGHGIREGEVARFTFPYGNVLDHECLAFVLLCLETQSIFMSVSPSTYSGNEF